MARPASVLGVVTLDDVSAEKKVRRIGKKIRQKRTMIRRGGRISLVDAVYRFKYCGLDRTLKHNKYEVDQVSNLKISADPMYHSTLGGLFMTNPTVGGK